MSVPKGRHKAMVSSPRDATKLWFPPQGTPQSYGFLRFFSENENVLKKIYKKYHKTFRLLRFFSENENVSKKIYKKYHKTFRLLRFFSENENVLKKNL